MKTPLLTGEHVRGLKSKMDTIHAGAADYMRASTGGDGGITGVMKIATIVEANGLDVELHGGGLAHRTGETVFDANKVKQLHKQS